MQLQGEMLTVCAVLVQVQTAGNAYAHTAEGACMTFTGERAAMIALFHRLRAYLKGEAAPLIVDAADWWDVHPIERSVCPNHMLPAITGEISYYTPY